MFPWKAVEQSVEYEMKYGPNTWRPTKAIVSQLSMDSSIWLGLRHRRLSILDQPSGRMTATRGADSPPGTKSGSSPHGGSTLRTRRVNVIGDASRTAPRLGPGRGVRRPEHNHLPHPRYRRGCIPSGSSGGHGYQTWSGRGRSIDTDLPRPRECDVRTDSRFEEPHSQVRDWRLD